MRRRGMLRANINPGLVNLSGSTGKGISQAGNVMMNLGKQFNDDDVRIAKERASELENKEQQKANAALNNATNPEMAKSIKENNPDVNLGMINLPQLPRTDKKQPVYEAKLTDEDGFLNIIKSDGTVEKKLVRPKDYQQPAKVKTDIPDRFILGSDVNIEHSINDGLYSDLADIGAFRRGKSGALYIDKAKYDSYLKLKNKDIK